LIVTELILSHLILLDGRLTLVAGYHAILQQVLAIKHPQKSGSRPARQTPSVAMRLDVNNLLIFGSHPSS
jgi:hypothetical protein